MPLFPHPDSEAGSVGIALTSQEKKVLGFLLLLTLLGLAVLLYRHWTGADPSQPNGNALNRIKK